MNCDSELQFAHLFFLGFRSRLTVTWSSPLPSPAYSFLLNGAVWVEPGEITWKEGTVYSFLVNSPSFYGELSGRLPTQECKGEEWLCSCRKNPAELFLSPSAEHPVHQIVLRPAGRLGFGAGLRPNSLLSSGDLLSRRTPRVACPDC